MENRNAKSQLTKAILAQCEEVSQTMKSLAYPARLKVLCELMEEEHSVNELTAACQLSQSAMSQLLARMKSEKVLVSRRNAHHVFYSIADRKLLRLLRAIKEIYCEK